MRTCELVVSKSAVVSTGVARHATPIIVNTDPASLNDFNPDESICHWWVDKTRRPNQQPRKEYAKHAHYTQDKDGSESDDHEDTELLVEWDKWLD